MGPALVLPEFLKGLKSSVFEQIKQAKSHCQIKKILKANHLNQLPGYYQKGLFKENVAIRRHDMSKKILRYLARLNG